MDKEQTTHAGDSRISRRELMKMGARLAAVLGLSAGSIPRIVEAMTDLASGQAPVLWLQAQSCTGCSISLLNSREPDPAQLLTQHIALRFHSNLSAASGEMCRDVINRTIEEGGFLLVVEGAIPAGMPEACMVGEESVAALVLRAAAKAKAVVALGTCASFGGIPAAENNPTGAVSVGAFLAKERVNQPVINLPGCPTHPDWLVGTLVHVLKFGLPPLDAQSRPKAFYARLLHDQCPRFADYERENFAKQFGDEGCLFKLGCLGPNTRADCTQRLWNAGTNSCIRAGAPCIGCADQEFASKASLPFFRKGLAERKVTVSGTQA
jgi:hydrogenase small subunit